MASPPPRCAFAAREPLSNRKDENEGSLEALVRARGQEGERKEIQIGKEVKLSAFGENPIIYVENPMEPTKELPELIIQSNQVTECQSHTLKSTSLLYPGDKHLLVEIKNNIYNCMKTMKYLGINLTMYNTCTTKSMTQR